LEVAAAARPLPRRSTPPNTRGGFALVNRGTPMNRFLPLAIPILISAACSPRAARLGATGAERTAVAVQVETVAVSPISHVYRASGTVRARQVAAIAAKIAATILEVRVHAGGRVDAGETLIMLDRRELEANLRRAEAARSEAESAAIETQNAIVSARASLELARISHQRIDDLLANALVSRQAFDESRARLESAEAALQIAVSRRRQVEARGTQAEAEVAAASVALGHATLTAPFAGLITERIADPGSLTTPGAPLLTLEREGTLRLEAPVDESRLTLVGIGQRVAVEIGGLNRTVSGRVGEIVPSVDSATRTFIAKIDLPGLPGLRAGMFGRAAFAAREREAVLVPESAVLEHGQIRSVHVLDGDTARLRLVTLGEARGNRREILSGLTAGERIVVAPPTLLADGGRVAVQEAAR
jgi:RND family efflux transporter MFP subunit